MTLNGEPVIGAPSLDEIFLSAPSAEGGTDIPLLDDDAEPLSDDERIVLYEG